VRPDSRHGLLMDSISIRGARTHNLKNVDLVLPRDKLIVVTGLSGSGKSSLAFDTLYAEGQRRYVESLSAYARQFLSMMEKPDVDHIEGLSPAISIEQKSTSHNPRSTVGTITEIYDYLRLFYARVGEPRCPDHGEPLAAQTVSQMVDSVMALSEGSRAMLLAPVVDQRKGEHSGVFRELIAGGFVRARVDGFVVDLDDLPTLDKKKKHTIEVVVDRFRVKEGLEQRLAESFETALELADGVARVETMDESPHGDGEALVFSARYACPVCGYSISELEPRMFSFNNPAGACSACDGLGVHQFFDPERIVHDEDLSLAEGAIRGWDRRNVYYFHMLSSLADHYGFDVEAPFRALTQEAAHGDPRGQRRGARRLLLRQRPRRRDPAPPSASRACCPTWNGAIARPTPPWSARISPSSCPSRPARAATARGSSASPASRVRRTTVPCHEITHDVRGRRARLLRVPAARGPTRRDRREDPQGDPGPAALPRRRGAQLPDPRPLAETLSGGEAQRIRLASQIGAGLVGVMYVLDEPSIGLHQRDNERLLRTLTYLRDLGNTVVVVEHDEDAIRAADHVIDIGPGAGVHGGRVVAEGTPTEVAANSASLTGAYLSGRRVIEFRSDAPPSIPSGC
jgi:excinuclease ABC subunit A